MIVAFPLWSDTTGGGGRMISMQSTLERCVIRLLERLKLGTLRCVESESLAGAPVVFAMDFNARFGAAEVVVAGSGPESQSH